MLFKDRRARQEPTNQSDLRKERRKGTDRRQERRVPLGLDFAVPVEVRCGDTVLTGLARNISEGGMLVQLERTLPIGRPISVRFAARSGEITLEGEIRHQVAWQHSGGPDRQTMYGIGVRFSSNEWQEELPPTSWVWETGSTIH